MAVQREGASREPRVDRDGAGMSMGPLVVGSVTDSLMHRVWIGMGVAAFVVVDAAMRPLRVVLSWSFICVVVVAVNQ